MAASAGIAKRATIGVGANFDQESINKFEKSLRDIHRTDESLTDSFNRTNQALDRFNEHLSVFSQHHDEIMDRLRESDDKAVESDRRVSQRYHDTAAVHNHETQQYAEDVRKQNEAALQRADNEVLNDRKQIEAMTHVMNRLRQNNTGMIRDNQHLKDRLDSVGTASEHVGNRIVSSNGRVSRSFNTSRRAVDRHMQSIRDAQSRDYRWLRTAQDMSGATLGLGAAFYKGAKDATTLQQAYIHAGNMAHYGGEKMSQVQHDINNQWRVGSNLSVKYGISQDQIAKGYQALVARGYTTNESLHTQKSLLQAAIASGDNYNDVVKVSTNVLDAYNMRSQNAATMTNNTKRVVNEMAYAADQTATNFQGLGIGMSYVAATAHTTHQSISETSSALGILSNKGMQASQAGVGLRKVLNSFLSVNKKGQQAQVMQQLGLSEADFKTASGHLKSLGSLMSLLNNKTKNMDSQERGSVFHRFFGATGQEAALNLASDTKGLAQLNDQVERSQNMGKNHQGYVALLSAHNMKSAQNQLHRFEQAWQAFTITSAREILPTLTNALKHADVYLAKLNDLSPRAKKWTIFGALTVAAIAPIGYAVFGIQSAFHGLEMTLLHIRHIFSKPVSSNMSNSMLKQDAKDSAGADITKNSSSIGKLSRVAKYDKGGFGYRGLSLLKNHPGTVVGTGSAIALGVGMGTFLGKNANHQAAKQISHIHRPFTMPMQENIEAKWNQASARYAVDSNKLMNYQLLNENKATYKSMSNQLQNYTNNSNNLSNKRLQALVKNGIISKSEAKSKLKADKKNNISLFKNANSAIKAISNDEDKYNAVGYQNRINSNKKEIKALRRNWNHLNSYQLEAHKNKINALQKADNKYYKAAHVARSKDAKQRERDWQNAYKAINHIIAGNGSKENRLYKKLNASRDNMSKRTAASMVRNSYKSTSSEINSANKDYENTVKNARNKYNTDRSYYAKEFGIKNKNYKRLFGKNGIQTKAYNQSIANAKNARKVKVTVARDEQNKITKAADKASGTIIKDNGKLWTNWDTTKKAFHSLSGSISSGIGDMSTHIENLIGKLRVLSPLITGIHKMISEFGNSVNITTHGFAHRFSEAAGNAGSFGHAHAIGGAIEHNELSLVNENGPESAYNPRTNTFRMLGNNGPQVLELHAGEHVLDAQDTKKILTEGLGRGITLPGYANGTDKLRNIMPSLAHGNFSYRKYLTGGYGNKYQPTPTGAKTLGQDWKDYGKVDHILSWDPTGASSLITAPYDLINGIRNKHPIEGTVSALSDLPGGKLAKLGKAGKFGKRVSDIAGHIGSAINPYSTGAKKLIGKAWRPMHKLGEKLGLHADKQFDPFNFKKWKPSIHKGIHLAGEELKKAGGKIAGAYDSRLKKPFEKHIRQGERWALHALKHMGPSLRNAGSKLLRGAKRFGSKAWRGIKGFGRGTIRFGKRLFRSTGRGIRRFGRGTMRFGRRMLRRGRSILRRASRGIGRFSRNTWSKAKHLGRRLWSGTKHIAHRMWSTTKRTASRMWQSAKRTGRNIWNNTKRISRNVSRDARSLWNRTKRGASNTWSRVVNGASRMASHVKTLGSHAWSTIKNGARDAKSVADSMLSGIISFAHRAAHAIEKVVTLGGLIGHHANGGRITHSQLSLVGERGPEAAYNSRTGSIRMLGLNGPQITELISGEAVLTHTQTNRLLHGGLGRGYHLPAYAQGTNARLSGPASKSSSYSIIGTFSGEKALKHMSEFSKSAKTIWDDVSAYISDSTKTMSADVTKTNGDLSDTVKSIFKEMKKKVEGLSGDLRDGLVQAAEDTASGFGDKFKSLITYAKDDMEDVIDKLNKGVRGIDVALKAFGGNSHVIHPIHYATGTLNGRIAYPQLGILNDAISGPRQEAILRGNSILFPQGNDVRVPLQKGDAVLNGDQTKELINNTTVNHYAKGSGLHINFKHLGQLVKTIGLALKGPATFFKKTFNHLVGSPSGHQLTKGMEESGIEAVKPLGVKWTRAMFKYIQSLLTPDGSGSASASAFLNYAERHRPTNYIFGGAPGLNDTDCSGFVEACLRHFGISAPRTSGAQIAHFQHITRSEARPGDLLGTGDHIGIVVDNGAHHYFSNHGPNGAHPAAGTDAYVPSVFPGGAASFARVPQLSKFNRPKHKNHTPFLEHLVASELGASATHWLKALAPMLSNNSGGGAGLASGNGVIATVWNEFAKLGMSPTQIEGALGGAKQESGFSPTAHDPDGGLGLFQATPPYGNLRAYAAEHHEDWKNPAVQAKQYFEHWLKPGGYLSTHGSVGHEAYEAASIEAHSHVDSGLAPDSDFGVRLAGAHEIQRWYESHQHANGGWASSPAIFGEAGPEVAINPARDTADHLIIEAINARIHHSTNSPIAGLIKSMNIKRNSHKLFNNIQSALSGNFNKSVNDRQNTSQQPVQINVKTNITIQGNPGANQYNQIKQHLAKAIQQGVQKEALKARNALSW